MQEWDIFWFKYQIDIRYFKGYAMVQMIEGWIGQQNIIKMHTWLVWKVNREKF